MADRYLLLSADPADTFCERLIKISPAPNLRPIIWAKQVGNGLMEGGERPVDLNAVLAVVIHLTPGPLRSACSGFDMFLRFKQLENEVHTRAPCPSHVIPTMFLSFFPDSEFQRGVDTRYGSKLGKFLGLLCASHLRVPFNSSILTQRLAEAGREAEAMNDAGQLLFYRTITKELISNYRPHH